MRILAGIITYNPDPERLRANITAILPQVDQVICVDNGSEEPEKIRCIFPENVVFLENGRNLGIAAALNRILEYAAEHDYSWFITLDHDSVCEEGLAAEYSRYAGLPDAAILTCRIVDRNFTEKPAVEADGHPVEIPMCISSASFCRTEALQAVGGFDEKMFIDCVDFDICTNLRKHGYKIYRIPFTGLLHEVGHGRNVRLLWKKRVIFNHSPLRNYYMARNQVYMARKYPQERSGTKTFLKEMETELLILLYESDKKQKIAARWRGIRDAKRGKMGEYVQ